MRRIVTPEKLKSKYVQGYSLECHLEEENEGEDNVVQVKEYIEDTFRGSDDSKPDAQRLCIHCMRCK